jgi:hypothetical protein
VRNRGSPARNDRRRRGKGVAFTRPGVPFHPGGTPRDCANPDQYPSCQTVRWRFRSAGDCKRERRPASPDHSSGRRGALHRAPGAGSGLNAPYAGPPPREVPKSRSQLPNRVPVREPFASNPSRHGLAVRLGKPASGDDAIRPTAVTTHGAATPRSICEGTCAGAWVRVVWACIVVRRSVVIVQPGPEGRKQKRSRDPPASVLETRRAFGLMSERPAVEGRDSRWPPV